MTKSLFLLVLLAVSNMYSQTFVTSNEGVFTPLNVSHSDVGDYDNDGDLDIIIMGLGSGNPGHYTSIYNNDGAGVFSLSPISFADEYRNGQVQFIDYDNDNDLDIFISGLVETQALKSRLYQNNSNVYSEIPFAFGDNIINNHFAWGDLDMDGDLDLILQGNGDTLVDDYTYLYRNDGSNGFTLMSQSIVGYSQGKILLGDIDNDGDNDILCGGIKLEANDYGSDSKFYRNNGDFTFTEMLTLEGIMNGDAELRDCNNDGFLDFIRNGQLEPGNSAKIYLGNGDFTFTEFTDTVFPANGSNSNFVSADYNGNGELDFLIANSGIYFYENQGDLTLTENTSSGINESYLDDIEIGDFDNDNDVDIFLIKSNSCKVYSNQSTIQNTIPDPPQNLSSSVMGSEVILNWSNATDNESPAKQLTYNLYIGTASATTDIVSPMSNLSTGYRKVTHIGNAQYKNQMRYTNLPNGTYYWAVQSIDNQYEGSMFSAEQTFTINNLSVQDYEPKVSTQFYPNPVSNLLTVSSNVSIKKVTINSILGVKLNSISIEDFTNFDIDFSRYNKGIYFVSLYSNSGKEVIKIIKR